MKNEKCPKCGWDLTNLDDKYYKMYMSFCTSCWYEDNRDYVEDDDWKVSLMDKDVAEKKWFIKRCKICGDQIEDWEDKDYWMCIICNAMKS